LSINSEKAFDVDQDGVAVRDANGLILFYLTTGTGDPTGSPAPQNTWYFRQDTRIIYYKFGVGNDDWRQLRAEDIYATDPSLNPTTVAAELTRIGSGGGTGTTTTVSFGSSGAIGSGAFVQYNGIPSNTTGFPISGTNPTIRSVRTRHSNARDYRINVYETDGITPNLLYTSPNISDPPNTNLRGFDITGLNIALTPGQELEVELIKNGGGQNPSNVIVIIDYNSDTGP